MKINLHLFIEIKIANKGRLKSRYEVVMAYNPRLMTLKVRLKNSSKNNQDVVTAYTWTLKIGLEVNFQRI